MIFQWYRVSLFAIILILARFSICGAEPKVTVPLWPTQPPGEEGEIGLEHDQTKSTDQLIAGKRVIRLGNVSQPTIEVFRPPLDKQNGTAVVVCPGGAYQILAMDLEGTEVCDWLNSVGVTAVLLKYRVPKRAGLEKHTAAFQDAQRAIRLTRQHSKEWGLKKIGVMGFSAGGHLAAMVSNNETRAYPPTDAADTNSCRADFTMLIYPAYLTIKEQDDKVAPELNVTSSAPPAFIVMAEDDPLRVETALVYSAALKKVNVPFELHIYPTGGHGYGLRPSKESVTTWPDRARDWLHDQGLLNTN